MTFYILKTSMFHVIGKSAQATHRFDDSNPGLGKVRPVGQIRPAKHPSVARELHLKFSKQVYWLWKHIKYQPSICSITKTTLKSVYMDMYRPVGTLLVSNVAREAKRVTHHCSNPSGLLLELSNGWPNRVTTMYRNRLGYIYRYKYKHILWSTENVCLKVITLSNL